MIWIVTCELLFFGYLQFKSEAYNKIISIRKKVKIEIGYVEVSLNGFIG